VARLAVAAGFAGVMLMLEPQGGLRHIIASGPTSGSAMAVSGAFLSAFVIVYIRQMSATETSEAIVFYFMSVGAVVGAITMIWWHAPLTWIEAVLLTVCGLLGGIGQTCMTYSYRYGEPSLLAPFDYLGMVWAVLFGFFLFGEIPERMVIAGSVIVIAAGLIIVWREHRHHRVLASLAESSLTVT
jgi:drug/metabolite transporter (DMT)-like permease